MYEAKHLVSKDVFPKKLYSLQLGLCKNHQPPPPPPPKSKSLHHFIVHEKYLNVIPECLTHRVPGTKYYSGGPHRCKSNKEPRKAGDHTSNKLSVD